MQKQIEQYTSNFAKDWLNSVMTESLKYRAYVQKVLAENNLPQELQYLPVIESSYKISALSKSGAYGMWQFMKNSISPFNIRINSWMDERKDPWLSTNAAVKKLKEKGYSCSLINARFVKPMDEELLTKMAENHKMFITIEDGIQSGGYGEKVESFVYRNQLPVKVLVNAIPDKYVEQGSISELRKEIGLDAESIVEKVIANRR